MQELLLPHPKELHEITAAAPFCHFALISHNRSPVSWFLHHQYSSTDEKLCQGKGAAGLCLLLTSLCWREDCRDLLETTLCIQGSFCLNPDALYLTAKHWHDWSHSFRQSYYGGDKHREVMDKHSFPVNLATRSCLQPPQLTLQERMQETPLGAGRSEFPLSWQGKSWALEHN